MVALLPHDLSADRDPHVRCRLFVEFAKNEKHPTWPSRLTPYEATAGGGGAVAFFSLFLLLFGCVCVVVPHIGFPHGPCPRPYAFSASFALSRWYVYGKQHAGGRNVGKSWS